MKECNIQTDRPPNTWNYVMLPGEFCDDERIDSNATNIYTQIERMRFKGLFITWEIIAKKTKLKRTAVYTAIQLLKKTGWLTVKTEKIHNKETGNIENRTVYILHWHSDSLPLTRKEELEQMAQEMETEYIDIQKKFTCEEINKLMANN